MSGRLDPSTRELRNAGKQPEYSVACANTQRQLGNSLANLVVSEHHNIATMAWSEAHAAALFFLSIATQELGQRRELQLRLAGLGDD